MHIMLLNLNQSLIYSHCTITKHVALQRTPVQDLFFFIKSRHKCSVVLYCIYLSCGATRDLNILNIVSLSRLPHGSADYCTLDRTLGADSLPCCSVYCLEGKHISPELPCTIIILQDCLNIAPSQKLFHFGCLLRQLRRQYCKIIIVIKIIIQQ